jgi:hypothetical protein
MADSTTTTYGLTKPEVGASEDTWGTKLNTNFDSIDDLFDGTTAIKPNLSTGLWKVGGTAITATAAELNLLDGVTATTAELNKVDGYTGSATELNYAKSLYDTGVTSTEYDYLDGVTSNIQTQLNAKADDSTTVTAGSGLSGGGSLGSNMTLSHADTSSVSNVNNSGNTFIQDLTFDTYGHVTGTTSGTVTVGDATITIAAGSGLSGGAAFTTNQSSNETVTLSHADTSTVSSVNNSGNTFIQDLTFDGYGHVTAVTSGSVSVGDATITMAAGAGLNGGAAFTTNQSSNETITYSIESDLRGDVYYIGRDTNDYIGVETTQINFVLDGNTDARLYNNGDFHADGNIIAYSTSISDERLKEDIVGIDDALNKVCSLSGYTFKYKADGKVSAGVIAQEVEKVLPEAVTETELLKVDDGNEYKVVNYDALHALLIESIKELKSRIEELEAK